MKIKTLRNILLASSLAFLPLTKSSFGQSQIKKESIQRKYENKEKIFYPFRTLEGKVPDPANDSVNGGAKEFLENSINYARKLYLSEKKAHEKYGPLIKKFLDLESSLPNRVVLKSNPESIKNSPFEFLTKKEINPLERLENFVSVNKDLFEKFYREVGYYGSGIKGKNSGEYISKRAKELESFGLKSTDCISYLLLSIEKGNSKKGFYKSLYSELFGFDHLMRSENFESIYIAENTLLDDSLYMYNRHGERGEFTKDYIHKIKNDDYFITLDYVVTDSLFHSQNFRKFIESTSGFLFIQEGKHTAFLREGNILEAHINSDPIYNSVFEESPFMKKFDNDDPKTDYQSAILFVPKGTVNRFMKKISLENKTK